MTGLMNQHVLAGIAAEESYVLGIEAEPGRLTLDVDFALTTDHPLFAHPVPGERGAFRRGTLVFDGVTNLGWIGQGAPPAIGADDAIDFGTFDTLVIAHDVATMVGDWGRIEVHARRVTVDLSAELQSQT